MKNYRFSISHFIIGCTLLLSGCGVFSLHPLYHQKDLVQMDQLVGAWKNQDDPSVFITIEALGDSKYQFTSIEKEDTSAFEMGFIKLNGQYFIDLFPVGDCAFPDGSCTMMENMMKNYLPVHSFMKIEISENEFQLTGFDNERLIKLFHEKKIRLAHEIPDKDEDDSYVVITASTDDLQKFISRYVNDKKAFDDTEKYIRL